MATIEDLKKRAAEEYEWASKRATAYREDGVPLPDPIRRVLELAAIANACEAHGGVAPADSTDIASIKAERDALHAEFLAAHKAIGAAITERPSMAIVRIMDTFAEVRSLIDHARSIIDGMALVAVHAPIDTAAAPVIREASDEPADDAHTSFPLRHGLVLVHLETRRRVLFSEPHQGRFVLHTITDEGIGPATDTSAVGNGMWHSGTWEEGAPIGAEPLPKWDAKKADTASLQAPVVDATAAPKPKVKDWSPTEVDIASFNASLNEAVAKAGLTVAVDVPSLMAKFKAERGEQDAPRPGVSFYHWAVKVLKG